VLGMAPTRQLDDLPVKLSGGFRFIALCVLTSFSSHVITDLLFLHADISKKCLGLCHFRLNPLVHFG
jgi:hypothetical protein